MRLSEIVRHIPGARLLDAGDPEISGVACDSRSVRPGYLFAAIRGARADGHDFLPVAAAAGAAAFLVEEPRRTDGPARVLVDDAELALGIAAEGFWGAPSRKLELVGITGTNGKTTTAYLVQHLLRGAGVPTGRFGTVSYDYPSGEEPAPLTTPDSPTLQAALARLVREGAKAAVIEVSSPALERRREAGCTFACTVFTNLTQDHLDYHGTMEAYFEAKKLLFTRYRGDAPAVVNVEDAWGRRLLEGLTGRVFTYGLDQGDVRLRVQELRPEGFSATLFHPGEGGSAGVPVKAPLAGEFNARNAAAALATAAALGLDLEAAARALASAPQVPGRIEAVPNELGAAVYVDYAHTPDALERVLDAVRRVVSGRILCVFGCGGDRDRGKRPLMGRAAAGRSDALVLTADNSRSEPTEEILDQIEAGLLPPWRRVTQVEELGTSSRLYARVPDRAEAIRVAVRWARRGDAVVIAGKGHETTQTIGSAVAHFDDREQARAALAAEARRRAE
jgi:UDP-N-acetylmuramoyl-L-alanyl-D-glutamate--2,6-diaminopimelate ligase